MCIVQAHRVFANDHFFFDFFLSVLMTSIFLLLLFFLVSQADGCITYD